MASLKRLPNGIWQVRWWTPDHRPAKKNFATKPEGQRFKTSLEHQLAQGAYIDINAGKRLFSDYAQDWLKVKAASVTERTWINQEGRLRNHLLPVLGPRQLSAIRPEDVRLLVAELTTVTHLDAATVRPVYFLLRRILTTAVADGLIARNPCIAVELPAEEQGQEMLFLTPVALGRLAEAVDPRFRALVLTAGYSGLRAGELSALKLERVLFLRRRLAVVEAHSEVRGRLVTKSTKTRRRREVPIPAALVDLLSEHVARYPSKEGFVFTAAEGGPVRHHNFYVRHYKPAVLAAGLPSEAPVPRPAALGRRHLDRPGLQREAVSHVPGRHEPRHRALQAPLRRPRRSAHGAGQRHHDIDVRALFAPCWCPTVQPGRPNKALTSTFVERTTGFEPATLTLAR